MKMGLKHSEDVNYLEILSVRVSSDGIITVTCQYNSQVYHFEFVFYYSMTGTAIAIFSKDKCVDILSYSKFCEEFQEGRINLDRCKAWIEEGYLDSNGRVREVGHENGS